MIKRYEHAREQVEIQNTGSILYKFYTFYKFLRLYIGIKHVMDSVQTYFENTIFGGLKQNLNFKTIQYTYL